MQDEKTYARLLMEDMKWLIERGRAFPHDTPRLQHIAKVLMGGLPDFEQNKTKYMTLLIDTANFHAATLDSISAAAKLTINSIRGTVERIHLGQAQA